MGSKVWHNNGDGGKYVHQARQEMDKIMHREREVMDENVKRERATADRMWKEERAAVKRMMAEERAAMDQRLKLFLDDMDHKLQQERKDMDRTVQLERGRTDFNIMQARANMDIKLQEERNAMDHKAKMEKIRMEGNMMQERDSTSTEQTQRDIPTPEQIVSSTPPQAQRDIPPLKQSVSSPPPPVVVMEFNVYVEYELSHIPQAYFNDRPGTMTFVEPHQVEWWKLVDALSTVGYKGNADVYYIKPGCVPPEGMVKLLGQDNVDKLMHEHEGLKKCDLIVVKNYPCSDDDMNGQDMYEQNMYGCNFLDTGDDRYLDMNRQDMYEETRVPCESPDRTERGSDEDGSSPIKKKSWA